MNETGYFFIMYKNKPHAIGKEYEKEFKKWLEWHQTSFQYIANHDQLKEALH